MTRRDDHGRLPIRRMPTVFGPSVGPRQQPGGRPYPPGVAGAQRLTEMSLLARSTEAALLPLLPDRVALAGEPRVRISATWLHDVGWLAGRGYNVVSVQIPARVEGTTGRVGGEFVAVLWENLTDPIITGREELGMPKVFAEIPDLVRDGDRATCTADWGGYQFFKGQITGLAEQQDGIGRQRCTPTINHKYQPKTGDWGAADADYITYSASEWKQVTRLERGTGLAEFRSATWDQLPTLAHIVNVLADLPLEVIDATLATINGASDYLGQAIAD
jgi:Acetoacetate decarboxylase (ADC)